MLLNGKKELILDEQEQFVEDILRMLEGGSLNDVKIKLSDGDIFANKDILIARTDYFATMLSNEKFREGETSSVDMSHCSKVVMERIIKYIFSGKVEYSDLNNLTLNQLLELAHMSKMLLLTSLKIQVEVYLEVDIVEESGVTWHSYQTSSLD